MVAKPPSARKLGLWMSIALVMGNMIGSGVFLLPASLAPYGLNSIVGWLLSTAGAIALAVVGLFAGLYSLWAIVGAGREASLWGLVLFGMGGPGYWLMRRRGSGQHRAQGPRLC
jgi:hypothetical protein